MKKFKVTVDIPDVLIEKIEELGFKKRKSKAHALKLIAVVLYALNEEEANCQDYYKPLSTSYIRDHITSYPFYLEYFLKHLQGQEKSVDFKKKIFQTDGSYCVGVYEKHYRINPEFLSGSSKEYTVEIEFDCLNELFPEVINHFNYSVSLIKPNVERSIMTDIVRKKSMQMGLMANGANSAFFNRSILDAINISERTFKLPNKINLSRGEKISFGKEEIEKELKKINPLKASLILVQEKNKKNKNKFEIASIDAFLIEKRRRFVKRVNRGIDRICSGEWVPSISASNGRFNHRFTYIDKFCVDFFDLDNEAIASFDLKASQPTILANLLVKNSKLLNSLRNSKYEKLNYLFERNNSVFFGKDNGAWIEGFLTQDIYKVIEKELNISRAEAKREMMTLLFTEPNVPSVLKKPLKKAFPEFINGLMAIKRSFKKNNISSKKTFPVFLQLVEAHIFIEIIYKEIAKANIPALPKHDSILFPKSRMQEVKCIIEECFSGLGFKGLMELETQKKLPINIWPDWYSPSIFPL